VQDQAGIPNRSNRKQLFSFNKRLYKLRWRVENAFNSLKDFRRIRGFRVAATVRDAGTGQETRISYRVVVGASRERHFLADTAAFRDPGK
jgi:transposase